MKRLKFRMYLRITDDDTGEVLCENATESVGNTQSVVHATEGISKAVTHAFEIAGSKEYMDKQKAGESLK